MKKKINQILDNLIDTKNYLLPSLISVSLLIRILTVYFIKDTHVEYEWNILLNNLIEHKSYSLRSFNGELVPSVLMPPLYAFFLYFIHVISFLKDSYFLYLVFFIQIILSTYSIYLFYQINQNFFSNKFSIINSFIFSIIPLNIYICGQISSANIQLFLSLLFLKLLFTLIKNKTQKNIIFFSIVSGLLILCRGEFVIIFVLTLFFIFISKKIDIINLIKILIIVFLVISPYVIRNYIHFNQFIITKSLGYNLWKGNNQLSKVEGYGKFEINEFKNLHDKVKSINKDKYYEINWDNIFLEEVINNIEKNPIIYLKLFFKKLSSFYFIDLESSYPNYYNFFHIFPVVILSLLSFPSLIIFFKNNKFENKYLGLYFFLNLVIFSIFFILPRYKIVILPVQIILVGYTLNYVIKKIRKS